MELSIMCDKKILTSTRAASAVVSSQVKPSHFPGGGSSDEAFVKSQDVVDCSRPPLCVVEDVVGSSGSGRIVVSDESMFERVKRKLRQAAMIASPAKSSNLTRQSSEVGAAGGGLKKAVKKTRHSWHQETTT